MTTSLLHILISFSSLIPFQTIIFSSLLSHWRLQTLPLTPLALFPDGERETPTKGIQSNCKWLMSCSTTVIYALLLIRTNCLIIPSVRGCMEVVLIRVRYCFAMWNDVVKLLIDDSLLNFWICHSQGDVGGPLVCNDELVGIITGSECGARPGIYTDVTKFSEWIVENNSSSMMGIKGLVIAMVIAAGVRGLDYGLWEKCFDWLSGHKIHNPL